MAFRYVRIEPDAIVYRRWPWPKHQIPRSEVDRFEVLEPGEDSYAAVGMNLWRFHYLALLTKDGRSFRVPSKGQPQVIALRLNNELR